MYDVLCDGAGLIHISLHPVFLVILERVTEQLFKPFPELLPSTADVSDVSYI